MKRAMLVCLLYGCTGGGGGGGSDVAVIGDEDAGADASASDAGAGDPRAAALQAYCERAAEAKCAWAFECVGAGTSLHEVLGLNGPEVNDCAEAEAAACLADAMDRDGRETLSFTEDAVDRCVQGLRDAPCVSDQPLDWVEDWKSFAFTTCAGVVRGTQQAGEACETRRDCAEATHICASGACRLAENGDLQIECNATNDGPGELNEDASCPGQVCAQPGDNLQGKTGMCTVDCEDGVGCPGGTFCLRFRVTSQAPRWFCTLPCSDNENICENGFECTAVSPGTIGSELHCYVEREEE